MRELTHCPICDQAKFLLEELSPRYEGGPTEWRVICYGCVRQTARCETKEKAMGLHTEFLVNLERFRERTANRGF